MENIQEEVTKPEKKERVILEIKNVKFGYSRKKTVLENVNLTIEPAEIVGISGENGSGKSTLLKLIVGLLKPQKGAIIRHGRLGYSPQDLLLFDNLTVMENFLVFGRGMGIKDEQIKQEAKKIMERLNFLHYKDTLVKNLSGGTAQKLNFGLSLLGNPDILVLDEPYQGMDYASFQAFWEIQQELRNQGKAIIIVSHLIEDKSKFTRSLHIIDKTLCGCDPEECPVCGGGDKK